MLFWWDLTLREVDFMVADLVGVDLMGVDLMGGHRNYMGVANSYCDNSWFVR